MDLRPNKIAFYDPNMGAICFPTVEALKRFVNEVVLPPVPSVLKPESEGGSVSSQRGHASRRLGQYLGHTNKTLSSVDFFSCMPMPEPPPETRADCRTMRVLRVDSGCNLSVKCEY